MKYDEALEEYVDATAQLPSESGVTGSGTVYLGSYATIDGETKRLSGEVSREHIALVLAHFRDTLRMAGLGKYRTLEL